MSPSPPSKPPPSSPQPLGDEKTPIYEKCPRCYGEGTIAVTEWVSDNRYRMVSATCPVCIGLKQVTSEVARECRLPSHPAKATIRPAKR